MKKLHRLAAVPEIKVITGVRRSGKSVLMRSFAEELRKQFDNVNVIYIDLTALEAEELKEYHKLNDYIISHTVKDKRNFVFIDEVQMCPQFELTINSLHNLAQYSIYISGSNAFLLSSDLATLFTGRTCNIELFPFSFKEYSAYFGDTGLPYRALDSYLADGGMSGSYNFEESDDKYNYIADIYDTLIIRDIKQKYKIRYMPLLEKISDYLMDNVSNLTSARNIAKVMAGINQPVHHTTAASYIGYLCNAFAFYKIRRYDIKGKRWLASNDKYYLSDHSFRRAKLGTKNRDYGRIVENVVAIELLRRGYELYVGTLYKKEIDFVAMKREETVYIQVCDNINDAETFKREAAPLLQIRDGYPKMILARTWQEPYTYEGIKVMDIADWLLSE